MYDFLKLMLVTFSLFQLHAPILVNARKLTTNNAPFSVDLIRRNSSKTILGSISYHHRIRLSSKFYETKNIETEVISDDSGGYAMKFSVGTPPVEYTAIVDTGSDLMCPCEHCLPQTSPLFDPKQSSTNSKISCTSSVCDAHQLGLPNTSCTQNNQSCAYLMTYGGGTQTTGVLSTETITFSSPATPFTNLYFGCGYSQKGHLGPQEDGLIGLGGGPLSLVTQIGPQINYKFSYCLTPPSSGFNSKLNFGLDVSEPGVVSTPFTNSQDTAPTYYYLTLESISLGATSIPVANNIIIDSGTTLTYLPSDVYDGVRTAMKSAIGLDPVADPTQMFDPCYVSGSDGFNPPDVVFHFSGADVVLKAENSFWMTNGLTCLAMLPHNTYIFGNVAQVNFHVGYDLQAKQVSFAPTDCSQFD